MLPVQQALVQILLCRGVVEDAKAQKLLLALGKDFELGNTALTEHFKCINNSIRNLGLEIRTVVLGEGGNRVFYHGVSNTVNDQPAEEVGSSFTHNDVAFFKKTVIRLVADEFLSNAEISATGGNTKDSAMSKIDLYLATLCEEGWLQRNDKNYLEIGPRSHLELRSLIESVSKSLPEEEPEASASTSSTGPRRKKRAGTNRLPQIIFY